MKKMLLLILPVLLLCGAPMYAMAVTEPVGTEVTIKLEDLSPNVVAQVLKAKKAADEAKVAAELSTQTVVEAVKATSPEELKAWLDVVGNSLVDFCKTLGVGANEFLKTPVGILIAGLAVFNYGGLEVINILAGLILSTIVWIIFTCIWLWSFRRCHFKRSVRPFWPWSKAELKDIEPAFDDESIRGLSMVLHVIVWCIVSVCCCIGAFAGW